MQQYMYDLCVSMRQSYRSVKFEWFLSKREVTSGEAFDYDRQYYCTSPSKLLAHSWFTNAIALTQSQMPQIKCRRFTLHSGAGVMCSAPSVPVCAAPRSVAEMFMWSSLLLPEEDSLKVTATSDLRSCNAVSLWNCVSLHNRKNSFMSMLKWK